MPAPTKWKPLAEISFSRRMVSRKYALPPSMMMSPGDSSGRRVSIVASVGAPALTMRMIERGVRSEATNSSGVSDARKLPSEPWFSMRARVLALLRLYTATV